jgi:hypothetical protein
MSMVFSGGMYEYRIPGIEGLGHRGSNFPKLGSITRVAATVVRQLLSSDKHFVSKNTPSKQGR